VRNRETLVRLVGEARIEEARRAMDMLSVKSFSYDARGRLEGGVRPAPPSTEPPSFARISWRGERYRPECRMHGKGQWCLHSIILALHHLGCEPEYKVRREAPEKQERKVGFQWQLAVEGAHLSFRLISGTTGSGVTNPLGFIGREPTAAGLPKPALELIEDLAEEATGAFLVRRVDAAPLLSAIGEVALQTREGEPWRRENRQGPLPDLIVSISEETLSSRFAEPVPEHAVFVPGWPGYLIGDATIMRFSGHVPDLRDLPAGGVETRLDAALLERLLRQKHGVRWSGRKPVLVDASQPGLALAARDRMLEGVLGVWYDEVFLPLPSLTAGAHLVTVDNTRYVVVLDAFGRNSLRQQALALRLPWSEDGTRFHVREQQAESVLRALAPPATWRVDRARADDWFGLERNPVEQVWTDGVPSYRVGGELFRHEELVGGLLENGLGARLTNGRTLGFDATVVARNESVMRGVRALHEAPEARARLLARITGEAHAEDEPVQLAPVWTEMLRTYQREGVAWMIANHRRDEPSLLADDMGLGKTIQALSYLDHVRGEKAQLIVVPRSLLGNWREECRRFCPGRQPLIHHGPNRTRELSALASAELIITSYGTLRRDIDLFYDLELDVVVLDEAQAIKNAASQTARAVAELWCAHRLALTGTPIENRLTELWAIFRFLAPGYLGEEGEMKEVTVPGTARFEALRAKVAPFMKRRLKTEVAADLPEKQEIRVELPMSDRQAALYDTFLSEAREDLSRLEKGGNTMSILTKLLRLRQICCHPGLVDEGLQRTSSNKLEHLLESLDEVTAAGHAALVFSQFTKLLGIVRYALEEAGVPFLYLDGATRDRDAVVAAFQAGDAPVFLISLKAGGTGLNLTRASYVYHLDPWWNPMVEAQATDRAHRIGQTRTVISYKLISEGTIEERILRLQAGKRRLAEGLWAENGGQGLDRETLLELLG